jgi:hypothetical protein
MIDRPAIRLPNNNVGCLVTTSSGEMENFDIRQENDAATSSHGSNAKVADILGGQEVLRVIAIDLFENIAAN